ncbi:peptide chain release factor N(5)-glutamine methyltransferase [Candidatus Pelagibacter sp.]|nr:peptide chain release factor N(5)-glutamine methyltransferase [Candidatus Pelagibacter sp.]
MKILDNLKDGQQVLKANNIPSYKIDCEILMSQILNISREEVLLNLEKEIKKEEKDRYFNLINRRKKKEPIAYITNNKSFWRDKFITNKNALIPRPDSEHLVEQTLKIIKKNQSKRILDVGVGSGCLSISILKERLFCKCDAIDLSKNALKLAKINANLHQLLDRIKFYKRDIDNFYNHKYDLIISNPPYINKHKIKYLGSINYEPKIALDGGLDGLDVIRKIISKSKYLLKNNGKLILEIGHDQKYKVINFLKKKNFFINKTIKDYGNNIRCIVSTKIN